MAFGQQYQSYYEIAGDAGLIHLERAFTPPADLVGSIRVAIGSEESVLSVPPCDHFGRMIEDVSDLIRRGGHFRRFHERSRLIARLARKMGEGCHG